MDRDLSRGRPIRHDRSVQWRLSAFSFRACMGCSVRRRVERRQASSRLPELASLLLFLGSLPLFLAGSLAVFLGLLAGHLLCGFPLLLSKARLSIPRQEPA